MKGFFDYSEAAAIVDELEAANEEVEEDTRLTPAKLSAYDAVVFFKSSL